jgi:hypothetical protein
MLVVVGAYGSVVYKLVGQPYVLSLAMLKSWKHDYFRQRRRQWEIQRKFFKALRPIRISVGDLYFFDEKSVLVLWHQIVDKAHHHQLVLISSFPLH